MGKKIDPKWILASRYLSMVHTIWSDHEVMGINLNYAGMANTMENMAFGRPATWMKSDGPLEERLAEHLVWIIYSRGRKHGKPEEALMLVRAKKFVEENRDLFAEIVLTKEKARV